MSSSAAWLSTQFISDSSPADADSAALASSLQKLTLIGSLSDRSDNPSTGHLASFVFLVSGLEQALDDDDPLFLDPAVTFSQDREPIGDGASFRVERAVWSSASPKGKYRNRCGKSVALKYSVHHTDSRRVTTNWKQLLAEVRALLHEPIRYHPNSVRLLGLSWGAVEGMRADFPALGL